MCSKIKIQSNQIVYFKQIPKIMDMYLFAQMHFTSVVHICNC